MELIRGKKLLKQIFVDHWQQFLTSHPNLRPAILINVEKMLTCGTEARGFHLYQCPSCRLEKRVPHTCKSRFCPSCGVKQTDVWIERYTALFANSQYQHIVFNPPSEFRPYFGIGRTPYFNALYTTVNQTLKDWYQLKGYLPGGMSVMHTFGRDCKFSPHIHVLMTVGGVNQSVNKWISCPYIPHEFLKSHFKQHFIANIQACWTAQQMKKVPEKLLFLFTPSYQKRIISKLLFVIWYVNIGEKLSNASFTVRYIGRYTKRPAIAESRIKAYDGSSVTFVYHDHKAHDKETVTMPTHDFIGKLIRHIPDSHFRTIRYFGFYANRLRGKLLPTVFILLRHTETYDAIRKKLAILPSWWRHQIERFTNQDPLLCSFCHIPLALVTIIQPQPERITDT